MVAGDLRAALLSSTALGAALLLGVGAAYAVTPQPLIVSAPAPGETYTVSGTETKGLTIIGDQDGGIGFLNLPAGTTLNTGVLNGDGTIIGNLTGSEGTATVQGPGTTWTDIGGSVTVGRSGTGTLNVSGGATVTANSMNIGYGDGGVGSVTLSGDGTKLTATGGLTMGYGLGSSASLTVENGAALETVSSGLYIQSGGMMTVTGADTSVRIGTLHSGTPDTWDDSDGWFYIGHGTVDIKDGAYLETDGGYVTGGSDGPAKMTVNGPDTVWDAHLLIYVGGDGNGVGGDGDLTISDGAKATASVIAAGVDPTSTATILVAGVGTSMSSLVHGTFLGNVYAGSEGNGTVIVQDGASLWADNELRIAYDAAATGRFVVGALEGDPAAGAGRVTAVNGVVFGDGDGQLIFNHTSDDYVFANVIRGDKGEIRQLAGVTELTADSASFFGAISVLGGTLKVNADFSGADTTVSGSGILGGTGTVGSLLVDAGGVVTPGNSIGTLHVAGDYTQNAGGTYVVELAADGSSDLIAVGGTAHLGGDVAIASGSTYALGNTYTIVTAGDVDGTFDTQSLPLSLFAKATLQYGAETAEISIDKARTFASAGATANQRAVGSGLDTMPGLDPVVYAATRLQSLGTAQQAFNALSGEVYASADTVIQQQSIYVRQAVNGRLRELTTAPAAQPLAYATKAPATAKLAPDLAPTLWVQGYGGWGDSYSDGNAATISNTIGGFLMGADVALLENVRAGVFGGYSRSTFDVDARASSGDMDNYDLGFYAGAQFGAIAARGAFAYAWHDVSADRMVSFPGFVQATSGAYSNGSFQVFGELGYDMSFGAYAFEPFVSVAYLNIDGADFRETGGPAALWVDTQTMSTTYTTLGVRAATTVDVLGRALTPSVTLGWQHAFGDTSPTAAMLLSGGSVPFQVAGAPVAEDALLVEAGLGYALSGAAALSVTYSGQLASGASQNAFNAQFSLKF